MSEQENVRVIKDAYDAFRDGDIEGVLSQLTSDVVWETQGPRQIPYAGTFRGKDGVAQFFRLLAESEEPKVFEPKRFFADGDMVVVLGHYEAKVKATEQTAATDWVQTFVFRDGKVAKYCEYLDTAKYAQAYTAAAAV